MTDKKIILIQRFWRKKKFKKCLKILNLNKNTTKNITFENFTSFIQKKKTLDLVKYLLNKIHRIVDYKNEFITNHINAREFLAAFVIYGYKDLVIGNEKTILSNSNNLIKIEKSVIQISNDLIRLICLANVSNLNKFILDSLYDKMFEFKFIFNTWKYGDHKQMVQIMTTSYKDIEENKKLILNNRKIEEISEDEKLLINNYTKLQINLLKKIKFLKGEEIFRNHKSVQLKLDENLKKHIENVVKKAYWDILKEELNLKPQKFNQLINILNEIRNEFCSLVPSRKDLHLEFYENIDTELIKQMAENNALDGNTIYNIVNYIINLILKLQPPIMDEETNLWKKNINDLFKVGFEYDKFLPDFLEKTFQKIILIKNYTEKLK